MQKAIYSGFAAVLVVANVSAGQISVIDPLVLDKGGQIVVAVSLSNRAQKDVANEVVVLDSAEIDRRQTRAISYAIRCDPRERAKRLQRDRSLQRTGPRVSHRCASHVLPRPEGHP